MMPLGGTRYPFMLRLIWPSIKQVIGWANDAKDKCSSQNQQTLKALVGKGQIISEQNCGVLNFPKKAKKLL